MNKKLVIIVAIISTIVIISFPFILKLKFLKLDENSYGDILAYSGAVLGGLLTLIGVYVTIENNKKERQEELELQYAPSLLLDIIKYQEVVGEQKEIGIVISNENFIDCNMEYGNYLIKLTNVGRGEIRDLSIGVKDIKLWSSSVNVKKEEIESYILTPEIIQFIPINGSVYLHIGTSQYIDKVDKLNMILELSLEINFKGIFNKKDYKYGLEFCLGVESYNNKYNANIDNKYNYSIYSTHLFLK